MRGNQCRFILTRSGPFPLDNRTPPKHSSATLSYSEIKLFVRRLPKYKCKWYLRELIQLWRYYTLKMGCVKYYYGKSEHKPNNLMLCTAHDDVFPVFKWTTLPSCLQMLMSAATKMEGVTMSATTLWAVTAAHVTKATCWLDATCVTVNKTQIMYISPHRSVAVNKNLFDAVYKFWSPFESLDIYILQVLVYDCFWIILELF